MANSSSEDETDTLPERPTRIQPYQFEPVRQDFERVPEHRDRFEANPMRYFMDLVTCSLQRFKRNREHVSLGLKAIKGQVQG